MTARGLHYVNIAVILADLTVLAYGYALSQSPLLVALAGFCIFMGAKSTRALTKKRKTGLRM